jgi:hypothetical protein
MLNYTSVLKDFALDNKGLYVFIATMLTHPLEDCVSHIGKTLAAVSSGTGKSEHYKSCDYHRFMDCHSSDFHEYRAPR